MGMSGLQVTAQRSVISFGQAQIFLINDPIQFAGAGTGATFTALLLPFVPILFRKCLLELARFNDDDDDDD